MLTPKNKMGSYKKMEDTPKKESVSKYLSKPMKENPINPERTEEVMQGRIEKRTTSMPKRIPTNPMPKKVTTTMGVDKSKGLRPGTPTAPMPVSKAKQIALNIASKLKRG